MNEKNRSPALKKRQLYIIDFASIAVWATEEERLDHLVYKLLAGRLPEVSETWTLEELGDDEETHPYAVLNNEDGTPIPLE